MPPRDLTTPLQPAATTADIATRRRSAQMSPNHTHQTSHPPVVASAHFCACSWLWKLVAGTGHNDAESPRGAQMEPQYQAPIVTPPASALALRTYEEEQQTDTSEQRRLLGQWSEHSATLRADEKSLASASSPSATAQPTGTAAAGSVGLTSAAGSQTSKEQHRRTGSASDIVRPSSAQGRPVNPSRHRKGPSLSSAELAGKGALAETGTAQVSVAPDDDDSNFCPTCLEAYTEDNPKTHTQCGHHYHLPCLYEWLERKDTCPMCESPLVFPGM